MTNRQTHEKNFTVTTARSQQISLADTSYYHIMSRCVLRSYLCGTDKHTDQCYEHRRQWIEDRIRLLSTVFFYRNLQLRNNE